MLVLSFFIISFFIIGICFGKVKISTKKLNFEMIENITHKNNFKIKVGIYLFGIIKILGMNFEEDGIKFLGRTIPYMYNEKIKEDVMNFNKKILKDNLKILNFNLEKINLNLKFGTDSTLITSFFTFAISTILSFFIQKSVTKYSSKKHRYIITPVYENRTNINILLELVLSIRIINILKFLFVLNNLSKAEHNKHKVKFKEIKI